MKHKLLSIDLDGTLLNKFKKISNKNLLSINKYLSDDGVVAINTGRSFFTSKKYVKIIDDFCSKKVRFISCYNGSLLYDCNTKKYYENFIKTDLVKKLYDIAKKNNIIIWVYKVISKETNVVYSNSKKLKISSKLFKFLDLKLIDDFSNLDAYKINFISINKKLIGKIAKMLEKDFKDEISFSITSHYLIEITKKDCTKGNAIKRMQKILKIKKDNIASFGDSFNDKSAFLASGLSVCINPNNKLLHKFCDQIIYFNKSAVSYAIENYIYNSKNINSNIKMIVSDLDGTLLNKSKLIVPETKLVLQEVTNNYNIPFTIATGRYLYDAIKIFSTLELNLNINYFLIVDNGAIIYNYSKKEYIYSKFINLIDSVEVFKYIKQINKNHNVGCVMHVKRAEILGYNKPIIKKYFETMYGDGFVDPYSPSLNDYTFVNEIKEELIKFVILFDNEKSASICFKDIKSKFPNLEICQSGNNNIEVNAEGVTKGSALTYLINILKIDPKNLMIFGDHMNDNSMLKLSNYSFCPISANNTTQKICGHPTDFESSIFIYKAINEYLLFKGEKENE